MESIPAGFDFLQFFHKETKKNKKQQRENVHERKIKLVSKTRKFKTINNLLERGQLRGFHNSYLKLFHIPINTLVQKSLGLFLLFLT